VPQDTDGLQIGEALGPYRLERILGEGGMGVVYLAAREAGGERVALKVLKQKLSGDATYVARFRREARVAAEVQHRHLVAILDSGELEGRHFLAVAYVGGGSLRERLRERGSLPIADAIRLAAQVAAGLDALHAAGIVHRDVKPPNIMLDENGAAALTDFGLAKGQAYTVLTRPGTVMGTIDYLAPELIEGLPATSASDIYALGCVVYECLTGAPPFKSENMFELVSAHLSQEPADPALLRSDLPAGVSAAVLPALAKEPEQRPRTGRAYAYMLSAAAGAGSSA
jgi:serine/threonine protein kinase